MDFIATEIINLYIIAKSRDDFFTHLKAFFSEKGVDCQIFLFFEDIGFNKDSIESADKVHLPQLFGKDLADFIRQTAPEENPGYPSYLGYFGYFGDSSIDKSGKTSDEVCYEDFIAGKKSKTYPLFFPLTESQKTVGYIFFRQLAHPEIYTQMHQASILISSFLEVLDPNSDKNPFVHFIKDFFHHSVARLMEDDFFKTLFKKIFTFFKLDYLYLCFPLIDEVSGKKRGSIRGYVPEDMPKPVIENHLVKLKDFFGDMNPGITFHAPEILLTQPKDPKSWDDIFDSFQGLTFSCEGSHQGVAAVGKICPQSKKELVNIKLLAIIIQSFGPLFKILEYKSADTHHVYVEKKRREREMTKNSRIQLMNSFSKELFSRNLDIENMVAKYAEGLKTYFNLNEIAVYLYRKESHQAELLFSSEHLKKDFFPATIDDSNHPVLRCIQEGIAFRGGKDEKGRRLMPSVKKDIKEMIFLSPGSDTSELTDVPHQLKSRPILAQSVLVITDTPLNNEMTNEDRIHFEGFNSRAAAAIENYFWYLRDKEKIPWMEKLGEIVDTISDVDKLYKISLDQIRQALRVDCCSIMTLEDDNYLQIRESYGLDQPKSRNPIKVKVGEEISGWVAQNRMPTLVENIEKDDRFRKLSSERFYTKSLISVPITYTESAKVEKLFGVININNKTTKAPFNEHDLELMSAHAKYLGVAIKNANDLKERDKIVEMQQQLEIAETIQRDLLPKSFPEMAGYNIYGISKPATEIGGDLFSVSIETDKCLRVSILDVSGKGIPAALLASRAHVYFNHIAEPIKYQPEKILGDINDILVTEMASDRFITAQYLLLDLETGFIKLSNAGHMPVIQWKSHEKIITSSVLKGIPLGIIKGESYFLPYDFSLEPGDFIVLFTDGITESRNSDGQDFGEERLEKFLQENAELNSRDLCQALLTEVGSFSANLKPHDDLTILILKRNSK